MDTAAGTAPKLLDLVPHLLCDLYKKIAKRRVLFAIQHQMLTGRAGRISESLLIEYDTTKCKGRDASPQASALKILTDDYGESSLPAPNGAK